MAANPASNSEAFRFIDTGIIVDKELEVHLIAQVPANEQTGTVPTYRFHLRVGKQVIGGVRFRAGMNREIELYAGNLGYNIDPAFRGQRFAERACRLLFPLAISHGFTNLWITCDPDNHASRITCERLGAVLVEIVVLPEHLDMYRDGEREKCRYLLNLSL